jgi:hypothetical protein
MDLLLLTFTVSDRIELAPHLDRWMMGDRFGEIVSIGRRYLHVQMDSGKTINVVPENATKVAEKWVDVVFAQGDDYTKIADMGVDEMAAYLAQWDYGQETDDAHTHWVPVSDGQQAGHQDRIHQVRFHDLEYTLNVNHPHGYAGLSRRPVNVRKTDTEGGQK